jgi:antitoxin component of RelBE/YafQ-DinJ toxin-antitoxin module
MMKRREGKSKVRFERVVFLKMTNEMHERLREFASQHGLTVSAAIRLLLSEALMRERERERE